MAEKSTVRLQNTIIDLLEVARIEKRLKETEEWLSINNIIAEILTDNQKQIDQNQIRFDIEVSEADQLYFSKNKLSSILANLITNAIKYSSPDRDSLIKIYTENGANYTKFVIEDNGIGIDLETHRAKLFQMFKRFHDHVEGTGVGLYIVKKLIEEKGGSLELESEVNIGTKLTLYFPQLEAAILEADKKVAHLS